VIELGAGCGLAGFGKLNLTARQMYFRILVLLASSFKIVCLSPLGMTLLGCDVTTTDQVEVLPLLMRNVERNRSWISQSNSDTGFVERNVCCAIHSPVSVILIAVVLDIVIWHSSF
jgi:hypothetical protein